MGTAGRLGRKPTMSELTRARARDPLTFLTFVRFRTARRSGAPA